MPYNFVADSFHKCVTVEALRAKRDRKQAISLQRGQFDPKFQVQGVAPTNHFCMISQANFAADSLYAKKLCSRLSSSEVRFFTEIDRFAFQRPPLGDLGATYDDHLRLIGKRVVDFLLALIELFCQVLRLRRYGRISVENRRFRSNRGRLTQNIRQKRSPPPTILLLRKLGLMIFVWYKNLNRTFYRFVTIHACDRQTDRQTGRILIAIRRVQSMQRGKMFLPDVRFKG